MSKKGEMFTRIFSLISEGKTAGQIISMGYPKSTVYWAIKQVTRGRQPGSGKGGEPAWMLAYRKMKLIHDCGDGRTGVIAEEGIWTDEGIIQQKVCSNCGKVLFSHFEEWTPEAKERYAHYIKTGYTGYDFSALASRVGKRFPKEVKNEATPSRP